METTASIKAPFKLALLALSALALSIFLVFGLAPACAFADGDLPASSVDTPAVSDKTPSDLPYDSTTASSVGAASVDSPDDSDLGPVLLTGSDGLTAADYPGDNGTDPFFFGLVPTVYDGFQYSPYEPTDADDPNKPYTVNNEARYSRDNNNAVHVYFEVEYGQGVELGVAFDYVRTIYGENSYQLLAPNRGYALIGWYNPGAPPLVQGVYHTNQSISLNESTYEPTYGYETPGLLYDKNGKIYKYQDEYFDDYTLTSLEFIEDYLSYSYMVPNRLLSMSFVLGGSDELHYPRENQILYIDNYNPVYYFPGVFLYEGEFTYYAQATYVFEDSVSGMNSQTGEQIVFVSHTVYASNPVVFHVKVKPRIYAPLEVTVVDDATGETLAVNNSTGLQLVLYKDYYEGTPASNGGLNSAYAGISSSSTQGVYPRIPEGKYKVRVLNSRGEYYEFSEEFTVVASDIETANTNNTRMKKTIRLKKIPDPVKYSVTFVDEDGTTVLLAAKQYNENTYGSEVETPDEPTKEQDSKYRYVFKYWEYDTSSGTSWTTSPLQVTSDITYRAAYLSIPKTNVTVVNKVLASGGVFAGSPPAGVTSYGIDVKEPNESTKTELTQTYASQIAGRRLLGFYEVDLIQYNDDNTTENLNEQAGEMSLEFPLEDLPDGTFVNIIQLHKNSATGETEVIEHARLVVSGGRVRIASLRGKLSTFIITMADDGTTDPAGGTTVDPANTGAGDVNNGGSSSGGSANENAGDAKSTDIPQNNTADTAPERVSPAVEAAGGQTAVAVGESVTDGESLSVTRAAAIDMVKTGEDSDAAETRDASAMEMLAFGATLAFMVMIACAIRRRETE